MILKDIESLKEDYPNIVETHSPKNKVFKNSFRAFWVGGLICAIGQFLNNVFIYHGLNQKEATSATTIVLIMASSILTGLNIFDKIGKYAGAGSSVPITGFANSMVSAAMEYKKEGFIYGMGAKQFTIAGPVIVFGTISSIVIGIIYYLL
ncbi:stage V sporulation protein AC [Candidatus Epulonipiscium fishelsonii]|uniref:Stage V sporulation protein AC n=1 Tax=Candidatus Epulonipiscium fishelsonii TaxID=77094 RepID=A0ACC8X7M2_9FIRM|nr:stage V sporulation protein AC [Epulopiscium sp. SCG-B11WGA-EpuloA1]ONI41312.1 stage V sporulation protein AC [Epulopiscium sp. SCG-B05WGA-EpuloA1]